MSVVYGDRGLSTMEFWKQLCKLEKKVVFILLRDFGVKSKTRNLEYYSHVVNMTDEDRKQFLGIADKYGITQLDETYPQWLLTFLRDGIMSIIESIKKNIRDANEIIPWKEFEYYDRRHYQDEAIRGCGELYDKFTLCKEILPIDANKYTEITNQIEFIATLLTAWRKSDNHFLRDIQTREMRNRLKQYEKEMIEQNKIDQKLKQVSSSTDNMSE